jgi:hypothetical protein
MKIYGENIMRLMQAQEINNDFGKFLDLAQAEPIIVTQNKKKMGVFLSMEAFENHFWASKAREDASNGYLSDNETADLLQKYGV